MHQRDQRDCIWIVIIILSTILFTQLEIKAQEQDTLNHLTFKYIPSTWDEGIPQGNGIIGTLLWQKGENLRMSLDRSDLWDLRPMKNLDFSRFNFDWVREQWENDTYQKVQEWMDIPYDQRPAPTKIPGGALEFPIKSLGQVKSVDLDITSAVCSIQWNSGVQMNCYVHAVDPIGFFKMEGVTDLEPQLIAPAYEDSVTTGGNVNSLDGQSLQLLGYHQGPVVRKGNSYTYIQKGWNGFQYLIYVAWKRSGENIVGCWSIQSTFSDSDSLDKVKRIVDKALENGYEVELDRHLRWWREYWEKSSITIPHELLERQWYLEMYKFGSLARSDAPPISLQGVWTADNGKIPPWKGDFHHDLNTELSYWPAYVSNHLDLEEGFINWLWNNRGTFQQYTKAYFNKEGLNVPGVTTLQGEPMGGWIQYSLGPTVSAWLAHHFYLHWKYSGDQEFLKEKAYPWVKDVAIYLEELAVKNDQFWRLPLSSSPEINNNHKDAWFGETTNFDLSLIRWLYRTGIEMAGELQIDADVARWSSVLNKWPDLALDANTGLMIAPDYPYRESHRHFSHLMSIHPLGMLDWSQGQDSREIIQKSLEHLKRLGPGGWVGYSYSWLANLEARALDGESAAKSLEIFARAFCLPNSFHVNGDQLKAGYSNFTYRPFTLEGNFAFAAALQEMLIQSHTGIIHIFPAVPGNWDNINFDQLRAVGGFLVSAEKRHNEIISLEIESLEGGLVRIQNPFNQKFICSTPYEIDEKNIISIKLAASEYAELKIAE